MNISIISSAKRGMIFVCLFVLFFLLFGLQQSKAQITVQTDEYHNAQVKLSNEAFRTVYSTMITGTSLHLTSLVPLTENLQVVLIDMSSGNHVFEGEWNAVTPTFEGAWQGVSRGVYVLCLFSIATKKYQTFKFSIVE